MILNLLRKVVQVVVLNPFKTKVVSSLVVVDVLKTPSLCPEDTKPNWNQENVEDGPPEVSVVLNHGDVGKVPFVRYYNLEDDIGPETVIHSNSISDLNIEDTIVAI